MLNHIRISKCSVLLLVAVLSACGGKVATSLPAQENYAPAIDPANFGAVIDNPYFPLKPGTTFIYEGKTEKGNERNEVQVTSKTRMIMGVTCVEVEDKVMVDGVLEEGTLDWYAQDKQGNVWYFGEDSKEYDANGNVTSTHGSWEAGVNGAQPGIIMKANHVLNDTYRQEYLKGEAEDWASIISLNETASVHFGSFKDALMTKEWSALKPAIIENKYYARGVGFILETTPDASVRLELLEIHQ